MKYFYLGFNRDQTDVVDGIFINITKYRMAERPDSNGIIVYRFKLEDREDIIRELNFVGLRYIDYGVQPC